MGQKKGSSVRCTVNGTECQLDDGMYDVKALYGAHTVLLHAPSMTAPSSSSLSPPSAADARRGLSGPLTNFTICAVDARGRFFVEPSGTYHVGAVGAVERHAEPEAQAGIGNVQCVPATTSKMAGESKTAAKEVRRAPNKYSMFLSKFSKTFILKGFQAGAAEWRRLSAESKKNEEVDTLISMVVRSGRYPLR